MTKKNTAATAAHMSMRTMFVPGDSEVCGLAIWTGIDDARLGIRRKRRRQFPFAGALRLFSSWRGGGFVPGVPLVHCVVVCLNLSGKWRGDSAAAENLNAVT